MLGIQELLDYTIDCLSDAPHELLSCALVAKAWVARAQRHIYRDLDMSPDPESEHDAIEIKVHRLSHTLENPYLLGLVHCLSVPLNSPALAALAHIPFTHLAEFRLECTSYPWAAPATPDTIAPLQAILRRPSLRRVHLWGYLEPISIIDDYFEGCARGIQELRLALDNLDAYPGVQPECMPEGAPCALAEEKIALRHLSVPRELEGWMRGPRCPFGFTRLRSLEVRASDWAALHGSVAPCFPQLEILSLTPCEYIISSPRPSFMLNHLR